MTGGVCYSKNRERGAWFEVKCVVDLIKRKEEQKLDASFERNLLKAWKRRDAEFRKYIEEAGF